MLRLDQTRLLVSVTDARHVRAHDFEIGVEAGVVGGHLEHAQVEESDGREGTASDEDQGCALAVFDSAPEPAGWELVLVHGHVAAHVVGHCRCLRFGWWIQR